MKRCTQVETSRDDGEQRECGKIATHLIFGDMPICDNCLALYRADPDWTEDELQLVPLGSGS